MNTYIIWNSSEYDTLADAIAEGAGKVIRTSIDLTTMQNLVQDITEYCCQTNMVASLVHSSIVGRITGGNRKPTSTEMSSGYRPDPTPIYHSGFIPGDE